MGKILSFVLNMSLTGGFCILAVCAARLLLKRAPKIFSYLLWAAAGFRLIMPFSAESALSLLPFKPDPIPADIALSPSPGIDSGIPAVDGFINGVILPPGAGASAISPEIWLSAGAAVWAAGALLMLAYGLISMAMLKKRLSGAAFAGENIYEAENLKTPLVTGLFRPRIYLPAGLCGREREYILLHERTHIRRLDHAVKMGAYFILCAHWFNPLAWLAFGLMCADMERSCDERVLRELGGGIKREYSSSLLAMSAGERLIGASPLAFGEGSAKARIKNILNYKKAGRPALVCAGLLVLVVGIGFSVDRMGAIGLPGTADVQEIELERREGGEFAGPVTRRGHENIDEILALLSGGRRTRQSPANDSPDKNAYMTIRLILKKSERTLYLYPGGGGYLIEEPYAGIYRLKGAAGRELYEFFERALAEDGAAQPRLQTRADFDRVGKGMSRGEILKILGNPHETAYGAAFGQWRDVYKMDGGGLSAVYYYEKEGVAARVWVSVPGLSGGEIAAGRAVVEKYFKALGESDQKTVYSLMTEDMKRISSPESGIPAEQAHLHRSTITLKGALCDPLDPARLEFTVSGAGSGTEAENVMVFRCVFHVKYHEGALKEGFNEGDNSGYRVTLAREGPGKPWKLADAGW